jgi:hypothetical protein
MAVGTRLSDQEIASPMGLLQRDDGDEHDGAAHTIVLVAVAADAGVSRSR